MTSHLEDVVFLPPQFVTKDSGARQQFATGSQRDTAEGKGIPSLIPTVVLRRLAGLYERGAQKYDRDNWRKGQPISRYYDSLQRHLWSVMDGDEYDGGEDHLAAVVWNAASMLWTLAAIEAGTLPAELDDRVGPLEVPGAGSRHHPDAVRADGAHWCDQRCSTRSSR
jgi:hypothetical protein